jgi:hypothetical protein
MPKDETRAATDSALLTYHSIRLSSIAEVRRVTAEAALAAARTLQVFVFEAVEDGLKPTEVAEMVGVSRTRVYAILKQGSYFR